MKLKINKNNRIEHMHECKTKKELMDAVFEQMLDYADRNFISRLADWGKQTYNLIEKNNKIVFSSPDNIENDQFIYAVALARIVGMFGMRAFNDHLSDEIEFSGCLPRVKLKNIWELVYKKIGEIYRSLVEIYKEQGEEDPNHKILSLLKEAFGYQTPCNEINAYDFVRNEFNF